MHLSVLLPLCNHSLAHSNLSCRRRSQNIIQCNGLFMKIPLFILYFYLWNLTRFAQSYCSHVIFSFFQLFWVPALHPLFPCDCFLDSKPKLFMFICDFTFVLPHCCCMIMQLRARLIRKHSCLWKRKIDVICLIHAHITQAWILMLNLWMKLIKYSPC